MSNQKNRYTKISKDINGNPLPAGMVDLRTCPDTGLPAPKIDTLMRVRIVTDALNALSITVSMGITPNPGTVYAEAVVELLKEIAIYSGIDKQELEDGMEHMTGDRAAYEEWKKEHGYDESNLPSAPLAVKVPRSVADKIVKILIEEDESKISQDLADLLSTDRFQK